MSPNRLSGATSPYLLQHADNPVDWHEWGPEVFEEARRRDVPILLSVGYSACHWCHVMAHESFEDPETARLMNESFVNVKVDREERPDVDGIYMDAVTAMSGHGGWPMTVICTPDGSPFFAGTYFPKEDRHGMPSFTRVLTAVAEAWKDRREELVGQGARVVEALARSATSPDVDEPLDAAILQNAHGALSRAHDPEWGGFGPAPKFPQPMTLELLLRLHLRGFAGSLDMVATTLDRMASGGIRDQVGGGFHRYSTDREWLVPHFEKMLYDNAQLARLYLHAFQVTGEDRYREVVRETLEYLLREMRQPEGGLSSAQDADSEGREGAFYVWSWDELSGLAGEEVARWLGAGPAGNWEGANVLRRTGPDPPAGFEEARRRLMERRAARERPQTDDKVLASWNGLAVTALAEAGRVLGEPRYVHAAGGSASFVLGEMRRADGRLLRSWRGGRTSGPGYLDDYAAMASACAALYETTFDPGWMREARSLASDMLDLFRDPDGGGFFQTGSDAEELVVRPRDLLDTAVPSGTSMAIEVLLRLSLFTGDASLEDAAVESMSGLRELMVRAPTAMGHALGALDLYLGPSREVAVAGDPSKADSQALIEEVWRRYLPNVVLAAGTDGSAAGALPLLAGRTGVEGRAAAYVCERFVCQRPVTSPSELASQLG